MSDPDPPPPRLFGPATCAALLAYVLLAVATTWPLVTRLGHDLPGELSDPVLNTWILGWDIQHLPALLRAEPGAWDAWWNANMFHPEPLTLAYSEHLLPLALLAAPIHALTGNLVLSYNLLFLASACLAAWGTFLLARDLLGQPGPAFLAGLLFGFSAYRVDQSAHLQVLSAQWMPFVLLGVHRYLATLRPAPLIGAALALVAQNLTCGYYLLYFPPFAALFALHQMWRRGRLADRRAWLGLVLAGLLVTLATLPFLVPYLEVHARGLILRDRAAVERFSADVFGYLSATPALRLWGSLLRVYPKDEGELFPGFVPLLLGAAALVAACRAAARASASARSSARWRDLAAGVLVAFAVALALAALGLLAGQAWVPGLRFTSLGRVLLWMLACVLAALALSGRWRRAAHALLFSAAGFCAVATLLSAWLSLGPTTTSLGRAFPGLSAYEYLFRFVPGFDGLRVPARFAMLVTLFLALLAAHAAAAWRGRHARAAIVLLSALFLAETWAAPLALSTPWNVPGLRAAPEGPPFGDPQLPPVYRDVARLPAGAVLVEFPFGAAAFDLRAMAWSNFHRRRLVNGFSGAQSQAYGERRAALGQPLEDPARALAALRACGATHAVVHAWAWGRQQRAEKLIGWLESLGARQVAERDGDVLLELGH